MKVLFAVSNDKMSETIIKQYEKQYKEIKEKSNPKLIEKEKINFVSLL